MQKTYPSGTKKALISLCNSLPDTYSVLCIDLELCLYRNFGNGYDVEISDVNTNSKNRKAHIYVWKDGKDVVISVINVPFDKIDEWVSLFYERSIQGKELDLMLRGSPSRSDHDCINADDLTLSRIVELYAINDDLE